MVDVSALTPANLSSVTQLGLCAPTAMRAMAQGMAWVSVHDGVVIAAATARLADGTVFLDGLVGEDAGQLALVDRAVAYARWSYAPALTMVAPRVREPLEKRGFVGLELSGLPPELAAAAEGRALVMRRV